MVYVTLRQSPAYRQISLEELLAGSFTGSALINANTTNTKTYALEQMTDYFRNKLGRDATSLRLSLRRFNDSVAELRDVDRHSLYDTFYIPKKSGGLRTINAPKPELMDALRRLKTIFEADFGALYHTSAFAYIRKRCTIDAVKRHQSNQSRWFGKLDLHDFFGSTTLDFVLQMFGQIYPFSEVMRSETGRAEMRTALELAFLDGGLPQGTPVSPLITNVMMIPIDYALNKRLREHSNGFVYTRYADDFIISSRYDFNVREVERLVVDVLASFGAPFSINASKTRYGSSSGRNWNLGVMLTADNKITIGNKKKRHFKSMLHNYIADSRRGAAWSVSDLQTLQGLYSYYRMVEGDVIDALIEHINKKEGEDVLAMIKEDLKRP